MVQIMFTIPDDKFDDFKAKFLRVHPIPPDEPDLTKNQWIKEWGKQCYADVYRRGRELVAKDNLSSMSEDIIT